MCFAGGDRGGAGARELRVQHLRKTRPAGMLHPSSKGAKKRRLFPLTSSPGVARKSPQRSVCVAVASAGSPRETSPQTTNDDEGSSAFSTLRERKKSGTREVVAAGSPCSAVVYTV